MSNNVRDVIPLLLIGSKGWAQFVNVNVELDMRRLNEGYYQLFDTIEEDIEELSKQTAIVSKENELQDILIEEIKTKANNPLAN